MVKIERNAHDDSTAARCCLFKGCAPKDAASFLSASGVTIFEFTGGETIPVALRENCWAIVLCGSVRIFSDNEGGTALLNIVGSGEPFDIAALTGRCAAMPASSAIAAGRCRVAFVRACDVNVLLKEYPRVAANCLAFFTGRIAFLNRKIHTLSCGSAEGKLADISIVDTDNTFFLSPGPFLANLVYSAHSDCIDSVIAGGRFVMKNREVEGERDILDNAREVLKEITL